MRVDKATLKKAVLTKMDKYIGEIIGADAVTLLL